jgi:hypothetical protein
MRTTKLVSGMVGYRLHGRDVAGCFLCGGGKVGKRKAFSFSKIGIGERRRKAPVETISPRFFICMDCRLQPPGDFLNRVREKFFRLQEEGKV